MKNRVFLRAATSLFAFATAALAAPGENFGGTCCSDKPLGAACGDAPTPLAQKMDVRRHPLRGVITRVDAENSALMVKHEAVPGVMRAMTMLFKVDPEVVKTFKAGDAITGLMSRVGNEWRLEEVKLASAAPKDS